MNVLISQIFSAAQYALILGTMMDVSLVPPGMRENKMASCAGTFFVGNMIGSSLTKTNAFEIYLDGQLLWSTLQTQRKPSMEDLERSFRKAGVRFQG